MPDLMGVNGLPVTEADAWNALVDRLHAVEPTRVWVPTARAIVTGRTAQLRKILKGRDRDARRTAE